MTSIVVTLDATIIAIIDARGFSRVQCLVIITTVVGVVLAGVVYRN